MIATWTSWGRYKAWMEVPDAGACSNQQSARILRFPHGIGGCEQRKAGNMERFKQREKALPELGIREGYEDDPGERFVALSIYYKSLRWSTPVRCLDQPGQSFWQKHRIGKQARTRDILRKRGCSLREICSPANELHICSVGHHHPLPVSHGRDHLPLRQEVSFFPCLLHTGPI